MRRHHLIIMVAAIVIALGALACGFQGVEVGTSASAPTLDLQAIEEAIRAEVKATMEAEVLIESEPSEAEEETLAEPTPEPAAEEQGTASDQLEILSHQSYEDAGWMHIVGEVRNTTNTPMEFVKIVATLYDDADNVTGTDSTYAELDVIPPGGKSPFETATDEWAGTTNYKLQVQGSPGDLPRQDLAIVSHSSYEDSGWLHVRGEVQNTGSTSAEFVKVVVTLYDSAGNVVGKDFGYTELTEVPPGGTSPFETGTDHWPNFDHYEIQIQGR